MEQQQLEGLKKWFGDYVVGFYGDDEFVNANLKLKQDHSRRTCKEMAYLTGRLNLPDNKKRTAEAIALLHDIGRFEQFVTYRTYNDPRSVDHNLLGIEVLQKEKTLDGVEKKEKELIEKAIEYHGIKTLPENLDGDCLLFSKLIRDADKIDIFYVVTEYYKLYRDNPDKFNLELELPDEPGYSDKVVEKVLTGRQIGYDELHTLNDAKLCQLGWVYDVNFSATLKRIKQRGLLQMLVDLLPQTEDIEKVREKVFSYVDGRIKNEETKK